MPNTAFDALDDDSKMIRETYAAFGLAMYHAQVLEHGLVNVIALARLIAANEGGPPISADPWDREFKRVFSELVRRFLSVSTDHERDLEGELRKCVDDRNLLAHRYWRLRSVEFMHAPGRSA